MSQLFENTVCLSLTFRRPGDTRRFKPGEVDVIGTATLADDKTQKAKQSEVAAMRRIWRSENYERTKKIQRGWEKWIERIALPSPLKKATHLLTLDLLDDAITESDRVIAAYSSASDDFCNLDYTSAIGAARGDLKELFRPGDYPTAAVLRTRFGCERSLFDIALPGENKMSDAAYLNARKQWADMFAETEQEVRFALRETCRGLVAHLAERLKPDARPDAPKKRLHTSAVDKLTEFLDLFSKRNVLEDDELAELVDKARQVVGGVTSAAQMDGKDTAQALRENATLASQTSQSLEEIKGSLDTLVETAPRRQISFDQEGF